MAKDVYKGTKLEGSYAGKVRGIPRGSGNPEHAPTPQEKPISHSLCKEQKGGK